MEDSSIMSDNNEHQLTALDLLFPAGRALREQLELIASVEDDRPLSGLVSSQHDGMVPLHWRSSIQRYMDHILSNGREQDSMEDDSTAATASTESLTDESNFDRLFSDDDSDEDEDEYQAWRPSSPMEPMEMVD